MNTTTLHDGRIVFFLNDKTALVRTADGTYHVSQPRIRVKRRTWFKGGKRHLEVVRTFEGIGVLNGGPTRRIKRLFKVILEVLNFDAILQLVHKIVFAFLPDQFVFRFKLGNLFDLAFGSNVAA